MVLEWIILCLAVFYFLCGIRVVRQTDRGLIETWGKYKKYADPGFHWISIIGQRIIKVDITEQMTRIQSEKNYITKDKLNTEVDLVVFFKVKDDKDSVYKSEYSVYNYVNQITMLCQTTARNVIGGMEFQEVNSNRNDINDKLRSTLASETSSWGVEIVRVELKAINPPEDVQASMNNVIKALNNKTAALDNATATETAADGVKRAEIKKAEGEKQAMILRAEGQKQSYELINVSFKGPSEILKRLEVTQAALENNSKVIITEKGISPQIIVGDIPVGAVDKKSIKKMD